MPDKEAATPFASDDDPEASLGMLIGYCARRQNLCLLPVLISPASPLLRFGLAVIGSTLDTRHQRGLVGFSRQFPLKDLEITSNRLEKGQDLLETQLHDVEARLTQKIDTVDRKLDQAQEDIAAFNRKVDEVIENHRTGIRHS